MSDPVTNMNVEDVLSSIRRLVSEDPDARKILRSEPQSARKASGKLVLTAAQRIEDEEKIEVDDLSNGAEDAGETAIDDSNEPVEVPVFRSQTKLEQVEALARKLLRPNDTVTQQMILSEIRDVVSVELSDGADTQDNQELDEDALVDADYFDDVELEHDNAFEAEAQPEELDDATADVVTDSSETPEPTALAKEAISEAEAVSETVGDDNSQEPDDADLFDDLPEVARAPQDDVDADTLSELDYVSSDMQVADFRLHDLPKEPLRLIRNDTVAQDTDDTLQMQAPLVATPAPTAPSEAAKSLEQKIVELEALVGRGSDWDPEPQETGGNAATFTADGPEMPWDDDSAELEDAVEGLAESEDVAETHEAEAVEVDTADEQAAAVEPEASVAEETTTAEELEDSVQDDISEAPLETKSVDAPDVTDAEEAVDAVATAEAEELIDAVTAPEEAENVVEDAATAESDEAAQVEESADQQPTEAEKSAPVPFTRPELLVVHSAKEPSVSELEEDELREIVARMIREELQGVLGERITRNVRKLVRREIQRALMHRDLD